MKKNAIELLGIGGAVFGAMLMQGCNTVYSNRANSEDLSLRPEPEMLTPEATGDVVPVAQKEVPYWQLPANAVPTAEVSPAVDANYTDYIVKKGDTLSGIAARYGLRWQDVAAVNPGLDANKVVVGKTIKLPGKIDLGKTVAAKPAKASGTTSAKVAESAGTYTVKNGDILGRIANAHGVKVSDIMKANGLSDANKLRVGQKLVIPGADKVPAKPAEAKPVTDQASKAPSTPANAAKKADDAIVPPPVLDPEVVPAPVVPSQEAAPSIEVNFTPPQIDANVEAPAIPSIEEVIPSEEQVAAAVAASFQTITTTGDEDVYAMAAKWNAMPGEILSSNPQLAQYTNSIPPAGIQVKIPLPSAK